MVFGAVVANLQDPQVLRHFLTGLDKVIQVVGQVIEKSGLKDILFVVQ